MKTVRTVILFPLALVRLAGIFFVIMILALAGMVWMKLFGFSRGLQYRLLKWGGNAVVFILGIRTRRNRLPDIQNFILMPNHRSYLDIFIVAKYTPAAFVAKAELKKWPLLKPAMKLTGSVFVARNEMKSLISTMHEIKKRISKNIPVVVFPEGTTYAGPLTRPFKSGTFKIAAETGIPVIPMAIHFHDKDDSWVDDDTFIGHFFRQMCKPVTRAVIHYGEPLTGSDHKVLKEKVRHHIERMLQEITATAESDPVPAPEPIEYRDS